MRVIFVCMGLSLSVACGDGAEKVLHALRKEDGPKLTKLVRNDLARHHQGLREAAQRLAPVLGTDSTEGQERERRVRAALKHMQRLPKGISELIISPITFLAAVGKDGKVIARDTTPDPMRGKDYRKRYAIVRQALDSRKAGYMLASFPAGQEELRVMLFAAPVTSDSQTLGAVIAGIPLRRYAQRLSRQLKGDQDDVTLVLWVYLYHADQLIPPETGIELESELPSGAELVKVLAESPTGAHGTFRSYGRLFGWLLIPMPSLGKDVGLIAVRSEPL